MKELFITVIYQPIFNIFAGFYWFIPDMGVVILLVTVLSKILLYPLTTKSIKAQRALTELQPKLEELKKQYKDDQTKMAAETMKLYREHKINPLSSCLPILIQLPIFIALYWVLQDMLKSDQFHLLYPFIKNPGTIKTITLGFLDLHKPSIVMAILAGAAQYWQARSMINKKSFTPVKTAGEESSMSAMMNKQMLYFMPAMTVIVGWQLSAGLTLYWFFSTVLTALQQEYILRKEKLSSKPDKIIEGKLVS